MRPIIILLLLCGFQAQSQCYEHTEQIREDAIRFITSPEYGGYLFTLSVDTSRATISNLTYDKPVDARYVFSDEKPFAIATIEKSQVLIDATGIRMPTDTARKARFCTGFMGDRFYLIMYSFPISQHDLIRFISACIPGIHSLVERNTGQNCVLVIRGNSIYADGPSDKPPEVKKFLAIRKH